MIAQDGSARPAPNGFEPVEVSAVESVLAKRWERPAGSATPAPSRSCAMNLVTYLEDLHDAPAISSVVAKLAATHPIRSIGIAMDFAAPEDQVLAWVLSQCSDAGEDSSVCSERIVLLAHTDQAARLASTAISLLSRDLPMVLWWNGGSPFSTRLFRLIAPLATKIVVDSKDFGDGAAALDTLRRLSEFHGGSTAVADLNWKRTTAWRETIAACCDDPVVTALIPDFDHCVIECSASADGVVPPPARALLLAGWITTCLPRLSGHGSIVGVTNHGGDLGSVTRLTFGSSKSSAALDVTWDVDAQRIEGRAFDARGAEVRRLAFAADPQEEAVLLDRCIGSLDRDARFDAVLRAE
ncbi:MAG TPA: glucose-6-phosphate dehydrogenase assembly protein OpcA [Candidatus Eremiobacteraceae bacterium]|nr:glucose-6-phosphate dehydrogenase assembly protein OpcA [Candidatus Eremiobacteraceae bacterium]